MRAGVFSAGAAGGCDGMPEPFADVAMDVSIDPTASRGGLWTGVAAGPFVSGVVSRDR